MLGGVEPATHRTEDYRSPLTTPRDGL
jgi:hypothetical protein